MIEYKAYHKKSLGKRMRPHAARKKKKKGKEASPGRSRFRQAIPSAAVAPGLLPLGAAGGTGVGQTEEREPVAMINLDALYYVDDRGSIFKRLTAYDAKNLPILTGFSRKDLAAKDPVAIRNLKKTIDLLQNAEAGVLRRKLP